MASLKIANIMVGEQTTVEQLIEKRKVMRISRHDNVYMHHVRNNYRNDSASTTITPHIDRLLPASRVLSS